MMKKDGHVECDGNKCIQ